MKRVKFFALIIALTAFSSQKVYAEMDYQGFVDSYQAMRLQTPNDFLSSRTRLRFETQFTGENVGAFVSLNAVYNNVVKSESGINLNEAYLEYFSDYFDFRVGKQIIIWGKAEGLQVTDLISPKDYSEFLARDFDDLRLGVDAFKARYLGNYLTFELIWLPIFTPAIMPTYQAGNNNPAENNPWAQEIPASLNLAKAQKPDLKFINSEIAAKATLSTSLVDCALSAFYTWDDLPVMHFEEKVLTPKYHRLAVFGGEFSIPLKMLVLRGEVAYYLGKYFQCQTITEQPLKKNSFNSLIGLDFAPGHNWTISAQISDVFIFDYEEKIQNEKNTFYATFNISKKILRETLTISTMLFWGLNHHDIYDRTSFDYAITDDLHLITGIDLFFGKKGNFSKYKNNSEVFVKLKYNF